MALGSAMPVASIRAGTIRKPPPMPKKPASAPTPKPRPTRRGSKWRADACVSRTFSFAGLDDGSQHAEADGDHHEAEQGQQPLSVDGFAELGPKHRAQDTGSREDERTAPLHGAQTRMGSQAEPGIQGNGDRRRADGDVSGRHADDIDEQGHGEDRAAPADESEDEPDDPTRPDGQDEREGRRWA